MTSLDRYIDDLVNNIEPEEFGTFPKNESSWEELFEFGQRRISEIVSLRKENARLQERVAQLEAAQQSVQWTLAVCDCNTDSLDVNDHIRDCPYRTRQSR